MLNVDGDEIINDVVVVCDDENGNGFHFMSFYNLLTSPSGLDASPRGGT